MTFAKGLNLAFHVEIDTPETLIAATLAPIVIFVVCEIAMAAVGIVRDLVRLRLGLPLEPRQ